MNQKTIRLLKNISTAMVAAAILLAFLISGIRIFGLQVFGVLTGSMEPAYPTGSLIYVKDADAQDLRVNDVITFSVSPSVIVTHRIVELVPDESNPSVMNFRTKGDANDNVDASLVTPGNIIGKVMFSVPQMGYLANYIQHPPGIYVTIFMCILMVAFVCWTDNLEKKAMQRGARRRQRPGTYGANARRGAQPQTKRPPYRPQAAAQNRPYGQGNKRRPYSPPASRPPQPRRSHSQQPRPERRDFAQDNARRRSSYRAEDYSRRERSSEYRFRSRY